jgi:uncharacterized protein (TIGR02453 family)
MFNGFPRESVAFLQDLHRNNNREWFESNRSRYETFFVKPALDLIEALVPVAQSLEPPHQAVPKANQSLRRVHRDTRFSKDKTPYNPMMHLVFWTGDHPNRSAGIHLVLAHDHFGYGAGHWAFKGAGLERYRLAVQDEGAKRDLDAALKTAESVGCGLTEPELKRVPAGFAADDPNSELLRRKGLVARTRDDPGFDDRLFGEEALVLITSIFEVLAPLDAWIDRHVAG